MLLMAGIPLSVQAQGQATLTGTVLDAENQSPLAGANVTLREMDSPDVVKGTATEPNGTFRMTDIRPGQYVVEVRFVGFQSQQRPITLEAGESRDITVELAFETSSLQTVVVSASRRQEKILDAPASISVLEPEDLQREVVTSSIEALRSVPGVDMAQTGIDRREVVLRGFNEAFSGATYVLTDYREAAVPSLAVNIHSIMPNMPIDIERVEVVRGPGSALYGPGVSNGVIHYFTKDPFRHPGTSLSVSGGSRAYFSGQFRQAGVVGDNWGYKITGQFARAEEWELDPNDPQDAREIGRYRIYDSRSQIPGGRTFASGDFDDDGETEFQLRREDEYRKFNVNGLLQYQAGDETTLSLNGGYSSLKGTVQSGIGTTQADGFGYSYGQVRLESGGLFAQVYLNANDAGDNTYVYGSGDRIIDKGLQWNAQVQYDFAVPSIGTQVIAGGDADLVTPRTEGRIVGRNEGDDQINEYGGYVQTSTDLTSKLALTLAARGDYNNVEEEFRVSPRTALVFKASPNHTFRGSFNQSVSSPGTNSNFLDIEAFRQPLGNDRSLVFRGLGAADGFSFNQFRNTGQVTFSLPVPGFFGSDQFTLDALPVVPMYGAVASQALVPTQSGVRFSDAVASQLSGLSGQQQALLAQLFGYMAQQENGNIFRFFGSATTDAAQLGIPNDSPQGFREVGPPPDISPLEQTTTQTFEVGYKGAIADRVLLQIDGYYEQKEDFISPLTTESPLVYLQGQGLAQDVGGRLGQIFQQALSGQGDPTVAALIQNANLPPDQVAQILAGIIGNGLNNTPTAVVQPDQEVLTGDNPNAVGGFLSYRNFGQVEYWGIDASLQVQATDQLDLFANTSIVSDDFFDNEDLDEANESLSVALNAPSFKAKGGFDYQMQNGFSFGATGNYVDGFPVETGPYVGDVDDYFLLDLRAGYQVPSVSGLRLDVTAKNVLNNEHREFVGAPELGAVFFARLTYSLP